MAVCASRESALPKGSTISAFVGRERELRILESLLEEATTGTGRVALLIGEAGIGKTRTARKLAEVARARGATVVWGTCFESEPQPFGPWIEVAEEVARALSAEALEARLGPAAPTLTTFVPALAAALPDLAPLGALPPGESRVRVYEAFARLLGGAAEESPLVIVLDDLQLADTASLEMLAYAGRALRSAKVLLVGAFRDTGLGLDHPLTLALADLDRQLPVRRLRLTSLTLEETGRLVEELLGAAAAEPVLAALHRETGGNPFFTAELTRHLLEEGYDLRSETADLPQAVPDSIRDAVARRLSRLSRHAARMLSLACCFRGPFEFAEVQALTSLPDEELLASIDEALATGMIAPGPGAESYVLTHALVRQTLVDSLGPSRRVRLHRRIAQALEEAHQGREDEHAAELAYQYARSHSLPGAEHGIRYAVIAADAARARSAYTDAASLLRTARDLANESDAAVRADVLTKLAVAEAEALEIGEANATTSVALRTLEEAGAGPEAVAAFLVRAIWALQEAGASPELAQPLVERGLALLGERRDLTWARLKLAEYPLEPMAVADVAAGRWLGFDPAAVEIARADGDDRDFAKTVELMDWRSRAQTGELRSRAATIGDPTAAIHVLSVVTRSLLFQHGAFDEAAEGAREVAALSERHGSLPGLGYGLVHLGWAARVVGQEDEAQTALGRAEEVLSRLGVGHRLHFTARFLRAVTMLERGGNQPELPGFLLEAARDRAVPPWMRLLYLCLAAHADAAAGNDEDRALLDAVVAALARLEPTTLNQNGAVAHAAWAAWLTGSDERGEVLGRVALDLIQAGVGDYPGTSLELAVAMSAALVGDPVRALDYAERARATLESGQRPLLATVDEVERQVRTRRRPLAGPAGLTPRELEILRSLAAGRTNREIAEALVLSVHTIERHVANVYRKIGAHNRAEATAYALRAGL